MYNVGTCSSSSSWPLCLLTKKQKQQLWLEYQMSLTERQILGMKLFFTMLAIFNCSTVLGLTAEHQCKWYIQK